MRFRFFLIFTCMTGLILATMATAVAHGAEPTKSPPTNVIVFLADDLGYGDLGCYGHPRIQTPNLDRFAKEGLRLTQCYSASSVCSPSRSAILTGRTPYRNGVFTWLPEGDRVHLRTSEITIARLLKDRGYATCHVGKWHLNGLFNDPRQPQPNEHGYDWWMATQNNAGPSHKDPKNFVRNGKPVGPLTGFSAPLVVEEAVSWLTEHRDKEKPFFMTVWTHEPHLPIESDPQFMAKYPDLVKNDPQRAQHHGNVTQLDAAFGRLMTALDKLKLVQNTLVFFTSDNGPEGRNPDAVKARTRGSTGGLRGRKRDLYEGGIRVPGIVRWPGHTRPGAVSDEPVIGSDIFSTVCAVAGVTPPADRSIDGVSLLPLLTGEKLARPIPLYWRFVQTAGPKIAMRIGDWKILADEKLTLFELYNIARDPQEGHDRAADEPQRLTEMQQKLVTLNGQIESEGPDWWKHYGQKGGAAKRPPRDKAQRKDKP